jgi:hypothetical protein
MGQFPATRLASEKHALVPHRSPPPHEPSRRQSPARSRRRFVTGLIAIVVAASAWVVSHTSVARGEAGGAVFVREEDAPAEYRTQGRRRGYSSQARRQKGETPERKSLPETPLMG